MEIDADAERIEVLQSKIARCVVRKVESRSTRTSGGQSFLAPLRRALAAQQQVVQ